MLNISSNDRVKLLAIVGPTASGKTALALHMSHRFNGEIINADSRLVYRGLNIGVAKPSAEEMRTIPHKLMDIIEPNDTFSLNLFLKLARREVSEISGRGKLPIVTGGTGQYVWAFLEGWNVAKVPPNLALRRKLQNNLKERGLRSLILKLKLLAPDEAERTDLQNPRRVIRAFERIEAGIDGHEALRLPELTYDTLIVGLHFDRETLRLRVKKRLQHMLKNGWKEEVKCLLESGITSNAPCMDAIGYREMSLLIEGKIDLEQFVCLVEKATQRLIRDQLKWFKRDDPRIVWIEERNHEEEAERIVVQWIEKGSNR